MPSCIAFSVTLAHFRYFSNVFNVLRCDQLFPLVTTRKICAFPSLALVFQQVFDSERQIMKNNLPESVREIADVIGTERALYLIDQLPPCGKRPWRRVLYVPKRMPADHRLVQILGWYDAQRLQRVFAGEILQVGTCKAMEREQQFARIHELKAGGMTAKEIADREQVTTRYINWVLKEKPPEELHHEPA